MQENIIHIPSFQGEYKTGLIFSMIDGLKNGNSLKFICDQPPTDLVALLNEYGLQNVSWTSQKDDTGRWQLVLRKEDPLNSASVGCCGMCGGHSQQK